MSLKIPDLNNSVDPDSNCFKSFSDQQQAKINEIRQSLGQLTQKLSIYCSDASIARHLIARNWDVKKASKMLKGTLKWRNQYKPEEIRWEEVSKEAETGKIYRSDYLDKRGRSVLVMRPGCQNTNSTKGQIRYLVYCMENAVLNLPLDQDQMVWLIDFHGFNLSNISIKVTRETAHILQDHYPERLGLAILYNPPKFFEPFWKLAKPFLEPKTAGKVKFVYSDDPSSTKIIQEFFDVDKLETAFGGNNHVGFTVDDYAETMRKDDQRMLLFWTRSTSVSLETTAEASVFLNSDNAEVDSDDFVKEHECENFTNDINSEHLSDSPKEENDHGQIKEQNDADKTKIVTET